MLSALACVLAILIMTGCSGGWAASSHVPPAIVVQPVSQSVAAGLSVTFSVTVSGTGPFAYQWYQGAVAISGANSSSYSTPTVLADNGAIFTVTVTNQAGAVTSLSAVLTVTAAALQSIAVTPASPSVAKGKTQQFTATGTYTDSSTQDITTTVTWASASPAVATIGPGTGLATGAGIGSSQITATQGAIVSPPDTLTVTAPTLQSIAVTPAIPSIDKGTTQQFTATGTYSDSSTQNLTASVTWASGTTAVATIGAATGLATAVTTGTSQITATLGAIVSPADLLTVINSTPIATSLLCSSTAPPYGSPINLVPTFSGGTAVIGSTGLNSSDITESAVSASSYPTPPLTSAKTYTLTVTGTGGNTASTRLLGHSHQREHLQHFAIRTNHGSRPAIVHCGCHRRRFECCRLERQLRRRKFHRECMDQLEYGGHLHDHRYQRRRTNRVRLRPDDHQPSGHHRATRQSKRLRQRHPTALRSRQLRHCLPMEFKRHSDPRRHQFHLQRFQSDFRQCRHLHRRRL
ncbi:MAG: Ig-like domain-containing protein [Candidatus Acidiferrales bacterium]